MREWIRGLMPSMFQRRLTLLTFTAFGVVAVLALQLTRLTVVEGAQYRERAEAALTDSKLIPTARGRILDRHGRVLATMRPSYDVAVNYDVITGQWAYRQARWAAYRADKAAWRQMSPAERERVVEQFLPPFREQVDQLWSVLCEVGRIEPVELELRRNEVVQRVQLVATHVWMRQLRDRDDQADEEITFADVTQPIREQVQAHALVNDVADDELLPLRRLLSMASDKALVKERPELAVWQQVEIQSSRARDYPMETLRMVLDLDGLPTPVHADLDYAASMEVKVEGVGLHMIGMMRRVWAEDLDRESNPDARPFKVTNEAGEDVIDLGGYLPGDQIGRWGVERSFETRLRGQRGRLLEHLDTGESWREDPRGGEDVQLSLDIHLQARVQAVMDADTLGLMKVHSWHAPNPPSEPTQPQIGEAFNGAAVVLDIDSGEVLAAVTAPGISLRQLKDAPAEIWDDDINTPWLDRSVARAYQPGSTVKPLVWAAAVTDGEIGAYDTIDCQGYYFPDRPTVFRDWYYKATGRGFGVINGPTALARSSNYFFYTLGDRLGSSRIVWWYDRYNLGRPTGCGLEGEVGGDLPDVARMNDSRAPGFSRQDAILMGIGQGPMRWTVLQAANSYATLARRGKYLAPTVMQYPRPADRRVDDLKLSPSALKQAFIGMDQCINAEYGSANHIVALGGEDIFNVEGVKILGKSGTAQNAPMRIDSDNDKRITRKDQIVRTGNHAWCITLVQPDGARQPKYVVAVVVEHGGSGGTVAGPVNNQIIRALGAEGYLW